MRKVNLLISYRVVQSWRLPVFIELSKLDDINLKVIVGHSFLGTKVVNASNINDFRFCKKIFSYNLFIRRKKGNICIPFNPSLFFHIFIFKPDIIITEGLSNLFNNIQCFIYSKISSIPFIQWGLGDLPSSKRSARLQYIRNFLKIYESFSDGALAYSTHAQKYYSDLGISTRFIKVVFNSVDIEARLDEIYKTFDIIHLSQLIDIPEKDQIVFLGALEPNKNVDKLLFLFKRLQSHRPELSLLVIGDGSEKSSLISLAKTNNVSNVKFAGRISQKLSHLICRSKIIILPSLGGLVFTEALVHGVPVVCGPADGTEKDLLSHQSDFVLSQPLSDRNFDEWFRACLDLLSSSDLRKDITLKGFKHLSSLGSRNYANKIRYLTLKLHNHFSC